VLDVACRRLRVIEDSLHLDDLALEDALRKLVSFGMNYQLANPDFVRLVLTTNIHRGEFLTQSKAMQNLDVPAIDAVRAVYQRGLKSGVFHTGIHAG
jgi:hypothetical protein